VICKTKIFFLVLFCILGFNLQSEERVYPDIKLTYGNDALFRNTLTTTELFVGQPFYLLIEASVTLETTGIDRLYPLHRISQQLWSRMVFSHNDLPLINISLVEANTSVGLQTPRVEELVESIQEKWKSENRSIWKVGLLTVNYDEEFIRQLEEGSREFSREERFFLRDYNGITIDAYYVYRLPIMYRPIGHVTRLILRIDPLRTGTQEIRFLFYSDYVPENLRTQIFRFTILPVQESRW